MAMSAALIAIGLLAAGPSDLPAARDCHGATVAEMIQKLDGAPRFDFSGSMMPPFLGLWAARERPEAESPPDSVSVFAVEGMPLILLYGRAGCALALVPTERGELWTAMRNTIGPAI